MFTPLNIAFLQPEWLEEMNSEKSTRKKIRNAIMILNKGESSKKDGIPSQTLKA